MPTKKTAARKKPAAPRLPSATLTTALNAAAHAILITDRAGTIAWVNPAFTALTGYPAAEVLGKNPREVLKSGQVDPAVYQAMWATILAGQVWRGQLINRRRDGSLYLEEQTITPVRDARGDIRHFIAIKQDITARVQADEQIRYQASLLESLSDAIIATDLNFVIRSWNKAAEDIYGWTAAEVIGQSTRALLRNEYVNTDPGAVLAEFSAAGFWQGDLIQHRRDGTPVHIHGAVSRLHDRDGQPSGAVAVNRDISARVQAEAALAHERNLLRTLIDNLPAAIYVKDRAGRFLVKNREDARRMGAATPEETVGKTDFDYYPADLAARYQADDQAVIQSDQPIRDREEPLIDAAGRAAWISTTKIPLRDAAGQIIGLVGIGYDITARKQRERELETLAAVGAALRVANTRAQMLPILLEQVVTVAAADGGALLLLDPASGELVIEQAQGQLAAVAGQRLPADRGIVGHVLATRQPYATADLDNDPHHENLHWPREAPAGVGLPLIAQGQALGLLWVGRPQPFNPAELRVLGALADMAANALHRAALQEQTEQRLQRLAALRAIDLAISASVDLRVTLTIVLEQVLAQLQADAADIYLLAEGHSHLEFAAGRGYRTPITPDPHVLLGQDYAGRVALERQNVSVADLAAAGPAIPLFQAEGFRGYYGVPLVAKGAVTGVLEVFQRAPLHPDADWVDFLEALAGQAAIAIDNAQLFDSLQRSNFDLGLAYDETLEGWSRALDLRDKETEGHSQRVTALTLQLAVAMGLPADELQPMRRGSLLHDIGKMGVPDRILLKPGPLTDDEWVAMRQHPQFARDMLAPIAYLRPALDIPYCHHEKWDGTGYPRGLAGEAIPLAARIFAVVDVWDALRSDRPYRPAWPTPQVRAYLRAQSGQHFDPAVVAAFEKLLLIEGNQG